jgi:hypothetical protein
MFRQRPTWERLLKLGDALTLACFFIARRSFTWRGKEFPVNGPLPSDMPAHRVRQFYTMRRLEITDQAREQLMVVMNSRMGVRGHATRTALPQNLKALSVAAPLKASKQTQTGVRPRKTIAANIPGISGSSGGGYVPSRQIATMTGTTD